MPSSLQNILLTPSIHLLTQASFKDKNQQKYRAKMRNKKEEGSRLKRVQIDEETSVTEINRANRTKAASKCPFTSAFVEQHLPFLDYLLTFIDFDLPSGNLP